MIKQRVQNALNRTLSGFEKGFKDNPLGTAFTFLSNPMIGTLNAYRRGAPADRAYPYPVQTRSNAQTTVFDLQNSIPYLDSALSQYNSGARSIPKGNFSTTVNDVQNDIQPMQNTGLPMQGQQPTSPTAPTAPMAPSVSPRIQPKTMPIKMPSDLNYIYGADQSAFQNIDNTFMPPVNAMTKNNGYFDMGGAGSVGGNWVEGAGWLTQADKMFGKTEEDLALEAQMRQRFANMAR